MPCQCSSIRASSTKKGMSWTRLGFEGNFRVYLSELQSMFASFGVLTAARTPFGVNSYDIDVPGERARLATGHQTKIHPSSGHQKANLCATARHVAFDENLFAENLWTLHHPVSNSCSHSCLLRLILLPILSLTLSDTKHCMIKQTSF